MALLAAAIAVASVLLFYVRAHQHRKHRFR
jgi:hypothetical protein